MHSIKKRRLYLSCWAVEYSETTRLHVILSFVLEEYEAPSPALHCFRCVFCPLAAHTRTNLKVKPVSGQH